MLALLLFACAKPAPEIPEEGDPCDPEEYDGWGYCFECGPGVLGWVCYDRRWHQDMNCVCHAQDDGTCEDFTVCK